MSVPEVVTLVFGVLFSGGVSSWFTARVNAKRSKVQNETDARGSFTGEFQAVVDGLTKQIDNLQEDVGYLRGEIEQLRKELAEERAYSEDLIKGYQEGRYPPAPSRYVLSK